MKIILDTNILISALMKDSITRKIIIDSSLEFFYPESSFKEIIKYESYILEKSGYDKETFHKILNKLLEYINLVPLELIRSKVNEATKIMRKIDMKDVIFIAAALTINTDFIWSEDKDFEKQENIKILKTKDLADKFFKNI